MANIPEYVSSEEENEINCGASQSDTQLNKQRRKKRTRNWNFEQIVQNK